MRKRTAVLAVAAAFAAAPYTFAQGPLNPPGPPAPTMKTLDQLDAKLEKRIDILTLPGDANATRIISQPGSYFLSANLSATTPVGISIRSNDVTVDLNGFVLNGNGTGTKGMDAATGGTSGILVRNGVIRGWTESGVAHANTERCRYEDLRVLESGTGLALGIGAQVVDCFVANNTGAGIAGFNRCSVSRTTVLENGGAGIALATGSSVVECIVRGNTGSGIELDNGAVVQQTGVFTNTGPFGIRTGTASAITGCAVGFNGTGNTAPISFGISTAEGSVVSDCTVNQQANANGTPDAQTGGGISVGFGSKVRNCTATANRGSGIYTNGDGSLIAGNTARGNGASGGDGAGISLGASANENRVDNNNVTGNDRGIHVLGTSNIILRNSAASNGATNTANYAIISGNRYGPIVDATPNTAPAVTSNSAASSLIDASGGSHPWANFAY